MVFSSLLFAFYFLPIVLLLYYLAQDKYKNYILLVASLYFYSYGEPKFVFVMIASIICNYAFALLIDRYRKNSVAKCILILDIVFNIGILFVFKYLDFSISAVNRLFHLQYQTRGILLPIGISFFTFQALSYVIDVYRNTVKVQKNPFYVALYISFFPQLIAGPIVRYSTIESQIINRNCTIDSFADGVKRFMIGFCKKIILANNLALIAQDTFARDVTVTNPLYLWLGSICFSLQIFYDFSGYSDMSIGLGKMFGFQFEENFNYPYIAKSITDFWRRWHISLSQWFRDYVYFPLGGSHVSVASHIFNLFIVWLLTGIWHGANYTFIVWGLGYFIILVIEKYCIKPSSRKSIVFRLLWQVITLLFVNFNWVIFNANGLTYGIQYCLSMVGFYGNSPILDNDVLYSIHEYGVFILLGIVLSTPVLNKLNANPTVTRYNKILWVCKPVLLGVAFIWAVSFLVLGAHNPFIYFNF